MFVVGLLFVLFGALAIVAALFGSDGTAEFLNMDLSAFAIFLIGLASGVAILWGYSVAKFGVKKSMQHRRRASSCRSCRRSSTRSTRTSVARSTTTGSERRV